MPKMRKVSLDEYSEAIKNKRSSDYFVDILCDPEDSEIIVIEDDSFVRAWQRVGENLRTAMGKMDEEIARTPPQRQREKPEGAFEKTTGGNPAKATARRARIEGRDGDSASAKNPFGALPSPDEFAAYREVFEDAPERILDMAEKNVDAHNEALISQAKFHRARVHLIGLPILISIIAALIFALALILQGHPVYATLILILISVPYLWVSIRNIFKSDKI